MQLIYMIIINVRLVRPSDCVIRKQTIQFDSDDRINRVISKLEITDVQSAVFTGHYLDRVVAIFPEMKNNIVNGSLTLRAYTAYDAILTLFGVKRRLTFKQRKENLDELQRELFYAKTIHPLDRPTLT